MPYTENFGTPGTYDWVVPDGVTSVSVLLYGARGGHSDAEDGVAKSGGDGGKVTGTLPTTPGETLRIVVGEAGGDGNADTTDSAEGGFPNGGDGSDYSWVSSGGGGGSSDIRQGGTTVQDIVALASAGGGGGAARGDYQTEEGASFGGNTYHPASDVTDSEGNTASGGDYDASGSFDGENGVSDFDSVSADKDAWAASGGGGGGLDGGGAGGIFVNGGVSALGAGGGSGAPDTAALSSASTTGGVTTGNGSVEITYTIPTFHYASAGSWYTGKTKIYSGGSWDDEAVKYYDSTTGTFENAQ